MKFPMIISALLLAGCAASTPAPESSPAAAPAAAKPAAPAAEAAARQGDPKPAELTLVSAGEVAKAADQWSGKRVAIEGVITKMCKKKGCWFEVTDGAGSPGVLITASRYHIFLSQGSEGRHITAWGEFKKEVQDLEEAKHLAHDAGEPEPTEAPVVLRLVADGVELK